MKALQRTPSKRLRVLHVLAALRGYGAERVVMDLLPELQSESTLAAGLTIYSSQVEEDDRKSLPFEIYEAGRQNRGDYLFLHRIVKAIRGFAPDVVHAHTHVGKYWGVIGSALARTPHIVYTEHRPCDPRRSLLDRIADRPVQNLMQRVVTFFPAQRTFLSKRDSIAQSKIATIANGLPSGSFCGGDAAEGRRRLGLSRSELGVLLVGRLGYPKNQQLALRALAALDPALRRRVRLIFAGGGENEPLVKLAHELEVVERVSFLGYRSDLAQLMAGCDVLLMTSLCEGMPLTLIESMLMGIPVVTTPWIGASEMLGDGRFGLITPGWKPENVAESLERALTRDRLNEMLVQRARSFAASEYAVSKMARAHEKLYAELHGAAG
ncbi:MAG TPA: glycosyltransferase family 4 protein [Candidatus Baltobacteraceae bacterium]|jgi:glycosyltransferase involved in cell wall biosynthesis|nr:glycosyltransferase family 4 protein [Candidatus Baltobacteraceae bacterium]